MNNVNDVKDGGKHGSQAVTAASSVDSKVTAVAEAGEGNAQ